MSEAEGRHPNENLSSCTRDELITLVERLHSAGTTVGKWMSAALDDPKVCAEMKANIEAFFKAFDPEKFKDKSPCFFCGKPSTSHQDRRHPKTRERLTSVSVCDEHFGCLIKVHNYEMYEYRTHCHGRFMEAHVTRPCDCGDFVVRRGAHLKFNMEKLQDATAVDGIEAVAKEIGLALLGTIDIAQREGK